MLFRKIGSEKGQIIALRAEVIVDHVEQHRQAFAVAAVHEILKIIGSAVIVVHAEQPRPVVTPVPAAGFAPPA